MSFLKVLGKKQAKRLLVSQILIFSGFLFACFDLTFGVVGLSPPIDQVKRVNTLFYFFLGGLVITFIVFMTILYFILHSDDE